MFTNIPSDKLCIRSKPQSITSFQFISRINMYNGNCQGKVIIFKMLTKGAGEMAQWLRALPALPKVLSSIPGNHMVAHNHL